MNETEKRYARRDHMALDQAGGYYMRHVMAMTAEGLHAKSDIAAELAFRDAEIDRRTRERDEARAERDALAKALAFYATQEHFILSDDTMWDTVSGEPPNWWCDGAGTATVEDGSIARLVLAGGQSAADVIAQIEKEKANGGR
jgi:hypothetical protein